MRAAGLSDRGRECDNGAMTQQGPFGGRARALFPTLPKGEIVASYESYADAQGAVDLLARADFPVARLSIVGNDLKSVERVTGKLTWGRVALAGAASGAWMGIFFGLLLIIFAPASPAGFGILIAAVLIGAGFGMLFGLVSYAINRRRRDFTSTMQVIASSYSIVVDPELAGRAGSLLAGTGGTRHPSEPPAVRHPAEPPAADAGTTPEAGPETAASPPRYGERLPERDDD